MSNTDSKFIREIFESSEEDERELVNLVFQNLKLEGKKKLTENPWAIFYYDWV